MPSLRSRRLHCISPENTTRDSIHIFQWMDRCNLTSSLHPNLFFLMKHELNQHFLPLWKRHWETLSDEQRSRWIQSLSSSDLSKFSSLCSFLSYWFPPSVPKDLPILDRAIGRPISVKQASSLFLEPQIHVEHLSSSTAPAFYDPVHNTMFDAIQMQWLPLHQFVQLKGTQEFMTHEMFQTLVRRSVQRWCGQQNVGFKSPREGHIFGNLVLFNYDQQQYFPQKSGTLHWSRHKNLDQIPSQEKPQRVIPSHYWKGMYRSYTFYLPDTPEGQTVLCLMKDAFKKGNLFAMNSASSGSVRHGRVHKKTALRGTYGYPDDSYLERVSGELNLLGSSPYTYQFSHDPGFTIEGDPYPRETRFQLSFSTGSEGDL